MPSDPDIVPDSDQSNDCEIVNLYPSLSSVTSMEETFNLLDPTGKQNDIPQNSNEVGTSSITVKTTNNDNGRTYDKTHICFYCEKPQAKLPRHLRDAHADMSAVCDWMAETNSLQKTAKLTKLRNLGNHTHNCKVFEAGHGEIIVKYRPNVLVEATEFVPCPSCYGYFAKRFLWKHSCPLEDSKKNVRRERVKKGSLLLPCPSNMNLDIQKLFTRLKGDDISRCVKSDDLIIELAKKEFMKLGHDSEQESYIRTKLREIGRLLIEVRVISSLPNGSLTDFIHPAKYGDVVSAARTVAGFDYITHMYKVPSLALKLGHTLKKCALILKSNALQASDDRVVKLSTEFHELCEMKWTDDVAAHAHRTLTTLKRNNAKCVPLAEDVMCLTSYLRKEGGKEKETLLKGNLDISSSWKKLNEITLTQVMMFNRRRQGEISKMTTDDYSKRCLTQNNDYITDALSEFEKELCKKFKRLEILGKKGNTVPVLLTTDMEESIDLLLSKRKDVFVNEDNPFLFPIALIQSTGHIRGSDCIRKYAVLSGTKNPTYLRSTNLRKQIAIVSQVLNLRDNEMDILAQFMGHDIRVHREFYRLPESTLQVAKISKLLLALEKGTVSSLKGKSLDEVTMDEDDGKLL